MRRLRASTRKSSSSRIAVANPSARATRSRPRRSRVSIVDIAVVPCAMRRSSIRARRPTMSRSRRTSGSMPGRCTFTTTSAPECSRAACTCATDAAPSGSGEIGGEHGLRRRAELARSSTRSTSAHGAGGTSSCSRASSSATSAGSRSRRVESSWPSLTNVTPPASSASRSCRASRARLSASGARRRPRRTGPSPCRIAMAQICQ